MTFEKKPARFACAARVLVSTSALVAGLYAAPAAARADATIAAWAESRINLSAEEALTLQEIARDLFPDAGRAGIDYARCVDEVDVAAADPEERASIDNAMGLVQGALRRLGHARYGDIADDDERARMAKMLTEGRWLRKFRVGVGRCLAAGTGG
jgi:hypothetical protein